MPLILAAMVPPLLMWAALIVILSEGANSPYPSIRNKYRPLRRFSKGMLVFNIIGLFAVILIRNLT